MADAGMRWIALNVGDYDPSAWTRTLQRATAASPIVEPIPWARLAHPPNEGMTEARAKLARIITAARMWQSRAIIPNLEKEAEKETPPDLVRDALDSTGWDGEVGWSLLGWLPNAVDFKPLNSDPAILQLFPTDMRFDGATQTEQKMRECVYHAREKGFTYCSVTWQTYGGAKPEWYSFHKGTRSLFTADDIGYGNWDAWAA